jgi:hypothetical protein
MDGIGREWTGTEGKGKAHESNELTSQMFHTYLGVDWNGGERHGRERKETETMGMDGPGLDWNGRERKGVVCFNLS